MRPPPRWNRFGWNRFWFAPADPRVLGFSRVVLMLGAFAFYRRADFESWGFVRDSFWVPVFPFKHLHLHPLGPLAMWGVGLAWKGALVTAGVGLFTRASCGAAFVLGLYLLGLPNNIGKVDHNDEVVLWAFGVMAVARSGDAWSVDAVVRAARAKLNPAALVGPPPGRDRVPDHPEYRWPVRAMQVLMVTIFFASGTAKLRRAGFVAWALSDNLRNTILVQQYLHDPWVRWGVWIAGHPHLCMGLAAFTLLAETAAPLALVSRAARAVLVPALFLMQVGNEVLLGINFRQFMLCYAFWVNWPAVGRLARAGLARAGRMPVRATVLYDGSCGLCTATMAVVRRLDLLRRVEVLDVLGGWDQVHARYPTLDQGQCLRLMVVVDGGGRATAGFDAYRALAHAIPLGWPALPFLYLPGVPRVGRRFYQSIADNRHKNGCGINRPAAASAPVG